MHLLHHITKAQTDAMTTFIDKNPMGPPINRIQSTLSSDLDRLFSATASSLTTGKFSEDSKQKRMADDGMLANI